MSVKVSTWVWQESGLGGSDLLIMLALADQADDAGKCWPSVKYIARKVRMSRTTVQRRMRILEAAGVIATCAKTGTSNRYQFTFNSPIEQDEGVPQFEGGLKLMHAALDEAGGASLGAAGGAALDAALNVKEPSRNHQEARATPRRATQFPDGFTFEDVREWTIKSDLPAGADDFEHFKNHHVANGKTFKDWHAAWRTWAFRSKSFNPTRIREDDPNQWNFG